MKMNSSTKDRRNQWKISRVLERNAHRRERTYFTGNGGI
jgi:hypothetical protein